MGGDPAQNSGTGTVDVITSEAHTPTHALDMHIDTTSGGGGTRQMRYKEFTDNPTDAIIIESWVYLPQRIGLDPLNDWFNLIQWKCVKGTDPSYTYNDPLWIVDLAERGGAGSGGNNYLKLSWWMNDNAPTDGSGAQQTSQPGATSSVDLPVGQWMKITTQYLPGDETGVDGYVKVWQDDVLVMSVTNVQTVRSDEDYYIWSINCYSDSTDPNVVHVYTDDNAIYLPPASAPVGGATISQVVEQDSDDSFVSSDYSAGHFNNTSGSGDVVTPYDLYVGTGYRTFLRWHPNIPAGATIESATIRFHTRAVASGTPVIDIYAAAVDDALQPANTVDAAAIMGGLSTATVTWTITGGVWAHDYFTTPDLSAVVQEIVDRAGWTHENHILFVLTNASGGYFNAEDFADSATEAPRLDLVWS